MASLVAGHIMWRCSRTAVKKVTKPPRVKSGPGTSSGNTISAIGATNMVKPTPPTPCKKAEPVINTAIKPKDQKLKKEKNSAMCSLQKCCGQQGKRESYQNK